MKLPRFMRRKDNPANRAIVAAYPSGQAVWTTTDYAALMEAGYKNCATVFACVSLIAKCASRINWTISKKAGGGQWKEFDEHPLLDLLGKPNPTEGGIRFAEKVISFLLLNGNSYITKIHGIESMPPKFLYTLRPDRVKIISSGNWAEPILRYDYTVGGAKPVPYAPETMLHLMEFHPLDDWYGLSRVAVAARQVDIYNESMEWNKNALQNNMQAPGILTGKNIQGPDIEKLRTMFKEKYMGSENAGKPLVLSGEDLTWTALSITPKDLQWLEGQKMTMRQICAIYNIASELLGDSENKTYSNIQEARKALYDEAVLPLMDIYRDELRGWLVPYYGPGLKLDYDRDAIEALQEDRGKKYAYLTSANFLTVNEKRLASGYDEVPDGDVILVGMGEMALEDAVAPAGDLSETEEGEPKFRPLKAKSLGGFWRGENERKALWQNFERRVTAKERVLAKDLEAWLKAQGRAAAEAVRNGAQTAEAALDKTESVKSYVSKFMARYLKLYATALAAGRRMTEGKLYDFTEDEKAGDGLNEATRRRLEKLIEDSAKVITDETLSEIQAVMRGSLGTNLTVQEIANAIADKVGDTMAPVRARRIARTETGMLENSGNLDGFKENEFVNLKGWICSFVEASREDHMAADGQEVGIDESFKVGGEEMDYPLDRSHGASAGNTINCLCAIYPVVG